MADPTATPGTPAVTPPSKPWYQSKTVWSAIVTALLGAIQPVSAAFGHPIAVPLWIIEVLSGIGLYSLRTSTSTIQ